MFDVSPSIISPAVSLSLSFFFSLLRFLPLYIFIHMFVRTVYSLLNSFSLSLPSFRDLCVSFCLFLYIIYLRERQPVELEILHTRTLPNRIREKRKPSTEWLRSAELFHFFSARLDLPEIYISILLSLSFLLYIYI